MHSFLQKIQKLFQKQSLPEKTWSVVKHLFTHKRKRHTILGCILTSIVMIKWFTPLALIPGISM